MSEKRIAHRNRPLLRTAFNALAPISIYPVTAQPSPIGYHFLVVFSAKSEARKCLSEFSSRLFGLLEDKSKGLIQHCLLVLSHKSERPITHARRGCITMKLFILSPAIVLSKTY